MVSPYKGRRLAGYISDRVSRSSLHKFYPKIGNFPLKCFCSLFKSTYLFCLFYYYMNILSVTFAGIILGGNDIFVTTSYHSTLSR